MKFDQKSSKIIRVKHKQNPCDQTGPPKSPWLQSLILPCHHGQSINPFNLINLRSKHIPPPKKKWGRTKKIPSFPKSFKNLPAATLWLVDFPLVGWLDVFFWEGIYVALIQRPVTRCIGTFRCSTAFRLSGDNRGLYEIAALPVESGAGWRRLEKRQATRILPGSKLLGETENLYIYIYELSM